MLRLRRKILPNREQVVRFPQSEEIFATQRRNLMGKTILQANLQHAKAAFYTIRRRFANELLDMAMDNRSRPNKRLGACISLKKDINGPILSDFCPEDVVAAQITVSNGRRASGTDHLLSLLCLLRKWQ
ncbi:hypothetical protein JTB14_018904 [Gonioctena quinquepunctata]|nr:hypothetical protein JTB14_018904 [Gonioctena quinquepunctata]